MVEILVRPHFVLFRRTEKIGKERWGATEVVISFHIFHIFHILFHPFLHRFKAFVGFPKEGRHFFLFFRVHCPRFDVELEMLGRRHRAEQHQACRSHGVCWKKKKNLHQDSL